MSRDEKIRREFCKFITKALVNSLSGESEQYCKFNKPSNVYPIGNIGVYKVSENGNEDSESDDFIAKYSPFSFGAGILVLPKEKCQLSINISFNIYYRVLPSFNIQQEVPEQHTKPVTLYKKLKVHTSTPFRVNLSEVASKGIEKFNIEQLQGLKEALDEARQLIVSDNETFPCIDDSKIKSSMDLQKPLEFETFIKQLKSYNRMIPTWKPELCIELKDDPSGCKFVSITLQNPKCDENIENISENFLFNAELSIEVLEGIIEPFTFNMLEDSYKYNRDMWGIGFNCTVERYNDNSVKTVHAPIYRQLRYGVRKKLPEGEPIVVPEFSKLAIDPVPLLKDIGRQMKEYLNWCRKNPNELIDEYSSNRNLDLQSFNKTLDSFNDEINRYLKGVSLLEEAKNTSSKYNPVYTAFLLMNKVFSLAAGEKYKSWKIFQIIFIVSELSGVVAQHWQDDSRFSEEDVERVTVLWFPTGGGKTEAYLGLTVFNLFFDRLRGKDAGMTALLRFPLRILTLQQFQRIFNVIMFANKVKQDENISGSWFSLGYWAGSDQTPNSIQKALNPKNEEDRKWHEEIEKLKAGNPKSQESFRRVVKCPYCGSAIMVKFDSKRNTVVHYCDNKSCDWTIKHEIMPIYIADDDLYKYLPSVIISTVDKVAVFGMQKNFLNLFGFVKYHNNKTGTFSWQQESNDFIEIPEKNCILYKPTLQIQDELHLLKEDLGAYDSHYESMLQVILRERSGKYSWKIIASTATIREYDRHIAHLYGKNEAKNPAIRFPCEGPRYDQSFYSVAESSDSVGRYYLGIIGHNKTHINTIVDVIYSYHKIIKGLAKLNTREFEKVTGITQLNEEDCKKIIDDYEISLNYVLTKRNADQIAESIDSQIQEYLVEDGYTGINNVMLTGGTSGDKLTSVLDSIEHPSINNEERITSVTATSMISHGVDIDRLNFMTFFGLPRQTAEYIQASSRVGRKWPGVTVDVFAPQKERDRSYYQFFQKYHEYLDRLVEAPAINRWAKYSIFKTISGILCGHIVNCEARRLGTSFWFMNTISGKFKDLPADKKAEYKERMREMVKRYYAVQNDSGDTFENRITHISDQFSNELLKTSRYSTLTEVVKNITGYSPMKSLRDTEEEAKFYPSDKLKRSLEKANYFGGK